MASCVESRVGCGGGGGVSLHEAFLLLAVVWGCVSALSHAWGLCCAGLSQGCRALHLCLGPVRMLSLEPARVVCVGIYAPHLEQVLALHWLVLGRVDCVGLAALLSPSCICSWHSWGQGMPTGFSECCWLLRPPLPLPSFGLVPCQCCCLFEPHWDFEVQLGHSAPAALSLQPASSVCSAYLTGSVLGSALAPAGGDAITSTGLRQ